ncbi:MAG: CidA/LrgA family protein [Eubacterium sp.]|nr:CidA/LrgA family protein [Eubacterium sp.]
MKWIRQFMILLAVTLLGEILRALIPFAIPAGIYGLVILFLCLCFGVIKLDQVEGAADFLIEIMPLCFIPAGVGLMTRWAQLQSLLLPVLISLFVVTVLVMVATGFATQYLVRRKEKKEGREDA